MLEKSQSQENMEILLYMHMLSLGHMFAKANYDFTRKQQFTHLLSENFITAFQI